MKIALLIPITSKDRKWYKLSDTYLLKYTLNTFLETKNNEYEYCFYIGFDKDDVFFSNNDIISQLKDIFDKLNIKLNISWYENIKKGHLTKMWNILYKKAYDDNYDYFYQCGDNVNFQTKNWILDSINILKINNNIGVSGPRNIDTSYQILTQSMVSRKHYEIFNFFFPESIKNLYYDNWISNIYYPKYFYKLNQHFSPNLNGKNMYDFQIDKNIYLNELYNCKQILNQYLKKYLTPKKKILYIGFYPEHKIEFDHIYINALKDQNYQIDKIDIKSEINEQILSGYDIIICGSFLQNCNYIFNLAKYYNKVIYNITEPIEFNNKPMYKVYSKNLINLTVGCVKENASHVKYPHYMDWGLSVSKIIDANKMISQITFEQVLNKKFCCMISRHDMEKTTTNIYNKLKLIGDIDCHSNLFNNYPNKQFEKIGRTNFQKNYLFNICPENFITTNHGYVTEKIFMSCIAGTIPIYYGDLDSIDKSIFNMDRIILFDPTSETSINKVYYKIIELMANPTKLYNFYTQPIFNQSAIQTYGIIIDNFKIRINNFINGKPYNNSLLTNQSYKVEIENLENKINGIDHIVWINLDRSQDRRINMEKILGKINIPNNRIIAIDGAKEDFSYYNNLQRPLTNYEKVCTLSHIKAYSYLKNISGKYFLVLEDDITLDNLKFFNKDLKSIIQKAPEFDILLLHKIYNNKLDNLYTKWEPDIYSTASYVISFNGLQKLLKYAEYNKSNNTFIFNSPLSIADYFLFYNVKTFVYKYNFISTADETSLIHTEHLNIHKQSSNFQLITIFNDLIFGI
jgi:GR25 family glycosyltransferase involved in LPS biosynthesis